MKQSGKSKKQTKKEAYTLEPLPEYVINNDSSGLINSAYHVTKRTPLETLESFKDEFDNAKPLLNALLLTFYNPPAYNEKSYATRFRPLVYDLLKIEQTNKKSRSLPTITRFINNYDKYWTNFIDPNGNSELRTETEKRKVYNTFQHLIKELIKEFNLSSAFDGLKMKKLQNKMPTINRQIIVGEYDNFADLVSRLMFKTGVEHEGIKYILTSKKDVDNFLNLTFRGDEDTKGQILKDKRLDKTETQYVDGNTDDEDEQADLIQQLRDEADEDANIPTIDTHGFVTYSNKPANGDTLTNPKETTMSGTPEAEQSSNAITTYGNDNEHTELDTLPPVVIGDVKTTQLLKEELERKAEKHKLDKRTPEERLTESLENAGGMLHKITPTTEPQVEESKLKFYIDQMLNDEHSPAGFRDTLDEIKAQDETKTKKELNDTFQLQHTDEEMKDLTIDELKIEAMNNGHTEEEVDQVIATKGSNLYGQTLRNMALKMHKYYSSLSDDVTSSMGGINRAALYRAMKEQKQLNKEAELKKLINERFNNKAANNVFNPETVAKANPDHSPPPRTYLGKLVARKANIITRAQTGIRRRTYLPGAVSDSTV